MRRVVLASLLLVTPGCGGSTSEPARAEPTRAESPEPEVQSDEGASAERGPRRLAADPSTGDRAAAVGAPRGQRPTVPPPPVEPPTF